MSRDPKAEVLAELRAKLSAMQADDEQKAAMAALLDQLEPPRSASQRRQTERVAFARHLFDLRESRPTIHKRLMARFSVQKSQADRDIKAALQVRPQLPEKWAVGGE